MRAPRLVEHLEWARYEPSVPIESLITSDLQMASTWRHCDGSTSAAACLRCSEPACRKLAADEVPVASADVYYEVCPVRALTTDASGLPSFLDHCVGCGLCVLRCPYGAISLSREGRPAVATQLDSLRMISTPDELAMRPASAHVTHDRSAARLLDTSWAQVGACLKRVDSPVFYPLVARLACAIGMPTVDGRGGDTSQRMDAVGWFQGASVPMEIKSYRETPEINIKAVQQALENKIIALSSRRGAALQTDYEAGSLAVGYAYPADRSGVAQLVQDYAEAFGIRIGIVTVRDLYILLVAKARLGSVPDVARLATLQGAWS